SVEAPLKQRSLEPWGGAGFGQGGAFLSGDHRSGAAGVERQGLTGNPQSLPLGAGAVARVPDIGGGKLAASGIAGPKAASAKRSSAGATAPDHPKCPLGAAGVGCRRGPESVPGVMRMSGLN